MDVTRFVDEMAVQDRATRRRLLELAALAGAGSVLLRDGAPALAATRRPLTAESVRIPLAQDGAAHAAGGWSTTPVLRAPRRVSLAGLAWGSGTGPRGAQVRGRRCGGEWSRWMHLHAGDGHAPDGETARRATDPVWLGRGDEVPGRAGGRPPGGAVDAG